MYEYARVEHGEYECDIWQKKGCSESKLQLNRKIINFFHLALIQVFCCILYEYCDSKIGLAAPECACECRKKNCAIMTAILRYNE